MTIAIIVTTASFNRVDDLKWPKIVCTDEMRGLSRFRILVKHFRHASHSLRSKQRHELVHLPVTEFSERFDRRSFPTPIVSASIIIAVSLEHP
ncbi:hypothetical protein [Candidatus Binatus sp.]|uniref:hypothetical protein n=1 Tax=Candidatus Binatus sp. TaxID=2811406 RepID=UPI003BAE5065